VRFADIPSAEGIYLPANSETPLTSPKPNVAGVNQAVPVSLLDIVEQLFG
jgi:hypothetical protein